MKPANVMLTDEGGIKIMDFGVARARGVERLPSDGYLVGTPAYMAPEQVLGEDVDERADLYSVGVLYYRLLTGALPFTAKTSVDMLQQQVSATPAPLRHHRADLPSWCDDIVERALAKSPADRFQSASDFREALAAAPDVATAVASAQQARQRRRHASLLVPFAACVASLVCLPMMYAPHPWVAEEPAPFSAASARFFDAKLLDIDGRERDAQLVLAERKLFVTVGRDNHHPLYAVPYARILSVIYSRGRDPLWGSLPARTRRGAWRLLQVAVERHWIAVRTNMETGVVVLRFDNQQIKDVRAALKDRTKGKVAASGRATGG